MTMAMSIRIRCLAIVVLLVAGAFSAHAQDDLPALVTKLDPAWQRLAASNAQFLTPDQQTLLHDLSFATAAVEVCPGFHVDKDAFKKGWEGFRSDDYMKLPAEQKRKLEYRLMVNYGAATALYAAEGLLHPKEACRIAKENRGKGPGRFWTPAAP
jgi:hypothetical protein